MEAITESILVQEIVHAVYAAEFQVKERYYLTQSLYLLLFLSKKDRKHSSEASLQAMRELIGRLTYVQCIDRPDDTP
jgi:hypothetical protein